MILQEADTPLTHYRLRYCRGEELPKRRVPQPYRPYIHLRENLCVVQESLFLQKSLKEICPRPGRRMAPSVLRLQMPRLLHIPLQSLDMGNLQQSRPLTERLSSPRRYMKDQVFLRLQGNL